MRVGFLGTGKIAAAMAHGLGGQGHQIIVSARNESISSQLGADIPELTVADNAEVVARSDTVFLCLMADIAREVLPHLPFRADQAIISVMADAPLAELKTLCAPATDITITIPLAAIAKGGSMLPVYPSSSALQALFGRTDTILPVASETALNAHFGGTALAAPLLALMQAGSRWLATQTGDAQAAEVYVAGFFAALLRDVGKGDADFDALLQSLATEGGLNAYLKAHMQAAGAPEALTEGLDALKPRLGL